LILTPAGTKLAGEAARGSGEGGRGISAGRRTGDHSLQLGQLSQRASGV